MQRRRPHQASAVASAWPQAKRPGCARWLGTQGFRRLSQRRSPQRLHSRAPESIQKQQKHGTLWDEARKMEVSFRIPRRRPPSNGTEKCPFPNVATCTIGSTYGKQALRPLAFTADATWFPPKGSSVPSTSRRQASISPASLDSELVSAERSKRRLRARGAAASSCIVCSRLVRLTS